MPQTTRALRTSSERYCWAARGTSAAGAGSAVQLAKQDDQVSAEADELLAHHSPSATARTTAATITARRIVDSMKGVS